MEAKYRWLRSIPKGSQNGKEAHLIFRSNITDKINNISFSHIYQTLPVLVLDSSDLALDNIDLYRNVELIIIHQNPMNFE